MSKESPELHYVSVFDLLTRDLTHVHTLLEACKANSSEV